MPSPRDTLGRVYRPRAHPDAAGKASHGALPGTAPKRPRQAPPRGPPSGGSCRVSRPTGRARGPRAPPSSTAHTTRIQLRPRTALHVAYTPTRTPQTQHQTRVYTRLRGRAPDGSWRVAVLTQALSGANAVVVVVHDHYEPRIRLSSEAARHTRAPAPALKASGGIVTNGPLQRYLFLDAVGSYYRPAASYDHRGNPCSP